MNAVTIDLKELTALLGGPPRMESTYALFDCPLCEEEASWSRSTEELTCYGRGGCAPERMLAALHGEPPECPKAGWMHDARSCLACSTRQGWVALMAREALKPSPVRWVFEDLATVDLDEVPMNPTIGQFAEGKALFRAGALNGLHGKPGSGKTWALYLAMAQETLKGNYVVLLDWEMTTREAAARLAPLGADLSKVKYTQPNGPMDPADLKERFGDLPVTLIGIDSVGEAMSATGLDSYNDGEAARWIAEVPKALLAIWPAAAVVMIDHLPKNVPTQQEVFPIGSQRKLAAVTTQYLVRTLVEFGRDVDGRAALICAKDRGGSYARNDEVAMLNGGPGGFRLYEATQVDKDAVAAHSLRQQILEVVRDSPLIPTEELKKAVTGRAKDVVALIAEMVQSGDLAVTKDGNKKLHSLGASVVVVDFGN